MYLIAGATTATGRELVPKLLKRRLPVRVLVRKDADAAHFARLGVEVVQGDVREAAVVARAAQGVQTLVSLIGRHFADTEAEFWEIEVQGMKTLIQAARAARVEHLVMLSVLWSDRDPGPLIFPAKRQAEDLLMQSGLGYTILRPSMFAVGPSSLLGTLGPMIERYGVAIVPAPDSRPISVLTIADLAEALLVAAVDLGPGNRVYELAGPEAITLGEGARRIAAVLGKKVRLLRVPRVLLRGLRVLSRLWGFAAYERMLFAEMLADHGFACEGDRNQMSALLGRRPQPVDAAIREYYQGRARVT